MTRIIFKEQDLEISRSQMYKCNLASRTSSTINSKTTKDKRWKISSSYFRAIDNSPRHESYAFVTKGWSFAYQRHHTYTWIPVMCVCILLLWICIARSCATSHCVRIIRFSTRLAAWFLCDIFLWILYTILYVDVCGGIWMYVISRRKRSLTSPWRLLRLAKREGMVGILDANHVIEPRRYIRWSVSH